jgi:hypothetical protein
LTQVIENQHINQHLQYRTGYYESDVINSIARATPFGTKPLWRSDQHQSQEEEFQIPQHRKAQNFTSNLEQLTVINKIEAEINK